MNKLAVLAAATLALSASFASATLFDGGSALVYRVGNGTNNVLANTGSPVFIDEYDKFGVLKQSVAMPTTGANALLASGTATSEGFLTVSPNGRYVTVTGYNRDLGVTGSLTSSASATVNRIVAVIDNETGTITYKKFTDVATGNNIRSAVTDNGNNLWIAGGAGSVRYGTVSGAATTATVTALANLRQVNVFDGQLYASTQSTGSGNTATIGTVGIGLPTSGSLALTSLPGFPVLSTPTNTYAFTFADLTGSIPGVDTLYVADEGARGLSKYSLVSGSWALNGTIGVDADDYRGVTAVHGADGVLIYATRKGGASANGGGELVSLLDASGYNGAFSGTPTLLASATTSSTAGTFNTAFRGVGVIVPEPAALGLLAPAALLLGRRRK